MVLVAYVHVATQRFANLRGHAYLAYAAKLVHALKCYTYTSGILIC